MAAASHPDLKPDYITITPPNTLPPRGGGLFDKNEQKYSFSDIAWWLSQYIDASTQEGRMLSATYILKFLQTHDALIVPKHLSKTGKEIRIEGVGQAAIKDKVLPQKKIVTNVASSHQPEVIHPFSFPSIPKTRKQLLKLIQEYELYAQEKRPAFRLTFAFPSKTQAQEFLAELQEREFEFQITVYSLKDLEELLTLEKASTKQALIQKAINRLQQLDPKNQKVIQPNSQQKWAYQAFLKRKELLQERKTRQDELLTLKTLQEIDHLQLYFPEKWLMKRRDFLWRAALTGTAIVATATPIGSLAGTAAVRQFRASQALNRQPKEGAENSNPPRNNLGQDAHAEDMTQKQQADTQEANKRPEQLPKIMHYDLENFSHNIENILKKSRSKWKILIKEMGGNLLYGKDENVPIHPASSIKTIVALLTLKYIQEKSVSLDSKVDESSLSFREALKKMLVNSDEEVTALLIKNLKKQYNLEATLRSLGLQETSIEPRKSSLNELALILSQKFVDQLKLQDKLQEFFYSLLAETAKQNTSRISHLFDASKNQGGIEIEIYKKPGTLIDPPTIVDTAVITISSKKTKEKRSFIFCIHGIGQEFSDLETTADKIATQFYADILLQTYA